MNKEGLEDCEARPQHKRAWLSLKSRRYTGDVGRNVGGQRTIAVSCIR